MRMRVIHVRKQRCGQGACTMYTCLALQKKAHTHSHASVTCAWCTHTHVCTHSKTERHHKACAHDHAWVHTHTHAHTRRRSSTIKPVRMTTHGHAAFPWMLLLMQELLRQCDNLEQRKRARLSAASPLIPSQPPRQPPVQLAVPLSQQPRLLQPSLQQHVQPHPSRQPEPRVRAAAALENHALMALCCSPI